MWLINLAWATIRYCLAPADEETWRCAFCGKRYPSECDGKCRR